MAKRPTGTATFLFIDIEGSTRLSERRIIRPSRVIMEQGPDG